MASKPKAPSCCRDLPVCFDRMDMFFEANDLVVLGGAANAVADAAVERKKRAIFLTEIGADSFTLVNDLLASRSAKEVELNKITCVLKEHYNPAPLEIAESFVLARVSGRRASRLRTL